MIEQRLTFRMTDHWNRIKNGNAVPAIQAFNPQNLDTLWYKCLQVSVIGNADKHDYIYDYVGEELIDIFGKNLTGQKVTSKLHFLPAKQMIMKMDEIINDPKPLTLDGQFIDEKNRTIKYRSCLLPFGSNAQNITHFVIGISWNSFN